MPKMIDPYQHQAQFERAFDSGCVQAMDLNIYMCSYKYICRFTCRKYCCSHEVWIMSSLRPVFHSNTASVFAPSTHCYWSKHGLIRAASQRDSDSECSTSSLSSVHVSSLSFNLHNTRASQIPTSPADAITLHVDTCTTPAYFVNMFI